MITTQARPHTSGLYTLSVEGRPQITHWLRVPSGACPVSRNPVLAVVRLRYQGDTALEVVALHAHVRALCRGGDGLPRSVEGLAARLRSDAQAALGAPVQLDLWLVVRPWQVLRVSC